jgi:hypothetical protein
MKRSSTTSIPGFQNLLKNHYFFFMTQTFTKMILTVTSFGLRWQQSILLYNVPIYHGLGVLRISEPEVSTIPETQEQQELVRGVFSGTSESMLPKVEL